MPNNHDPLTWKELHHSAVENFFHFYDMSPLSILNSIPPSIMAQWCWKHNEIYGYRTLTLEGIEEEILNACMESLQRIGFDSELRFASLSETKDMHYIEASVYWALKCYGQIIADSESFILQSHR